LALFGFAQPFWHMVLDHISIEQNDGNAPSGLRWKRYPADGETRYTGIVRIAAEA
jgi:hypothetical protein